MIYFGNPCDELVRGAMRAGKLGVIHTPDQGNAVVPGAAWVADNGCFGKGYPGDDEWIRWLGQHPGDRSLCMFATAPDVVGDFAATEVRARPWLERIRGLGYAAALVAQDGMEWSTWDCWDEIDALFIGGSTDWKLGPAAADLAAVAQSLGKWVHMGRVNTKKRIGYASYIGCDSVDGTTLTRGSRRNLPPLLRWMDEVNSQYRTAGIGF